MANLSNINGKFLFTDGDFLLIGGATANNISATESGVAIKNSNAATLSLQNSATNGKNHTLWSNTDGSFNITDVGVATRFTIASGGDVYIPSGNVSIGNTSVYPSGSNTILQIYSVSVPRLKLQNSTTGTAATAGSSFYVTGDDLIINNGETGAIIQFEIGGQSKMRIDGDGNVGIGTISPIQKLHLNNSATLTPTYQKFTNGTATTGTTLGIDADGDFIINNGENKEIKLYTSDSQRLTIQSGGNVGIGDDNPSNLLTLYKNATQGNPSSHTPANATLKIEDSANTMYLDGNSIVATGSAAFTMGNTAAVDFILYTDATERMRIDSSGNVNVTGRYLSLTDSDYTYILGKRTSPSDGFYLTRLMGYGDNTFYGSFDVLRHDANDGELRMRQLVAGTVTDVMTIVDGNVGIGTTSPNQLLEISENGSPVMRLNSSKTTNGAAGDSIGRIEWRGSNTAGNGAGIKAAIDTSATTTTQRDFNLLFKTSNNVGSGEPETRMQINANGNVGIGTTSPDEKLSVNGNIFLQGNDDYIAFNTSASSGHPKIKMNSDADFSFLNTAGSNLLHIENGGNVGIGTTSPITAGGSYKGMQIKNGSGSSLVLSNTSHNHYIYTGGSTGELSIEASEEFRVRTNGSERMRITSGGDVLIDKTSAGIANDGIEFNPNGQSIFTCTGGEGINVNRKGTDGNLIRFFNDGTLCGRISQSGNTTSYITSSDYRLKENVVEMTGALDRVSQLKPSRFNFIAYADTTVDGFLAHEVQEIVPEAISGEKDAVDEEGNPEYQGIDQSKLVPLLVGAIQELKAEIELLKTQINN